jgi:hypothetical protein
MLAVGPHLSISKGLCDALDVALSIGATTFQFFSRNPRGGASKPLDDTDLSNFIKRIKDTLNSDEYAWTKLNNISIVKYNDWSSIVVERTAWFDITSNIKAEAKFENYRKTVQKVLERRKNKNSW